MSTIYGRRDRWLERETLSRADEDRLARNPQMLGEYLQELHWRFVELQKEVERLRAELTGRQQSSS